MKKHTKRKHATKRKIKGGFSVDERRLHVFARKSREDIFEDVAEEISQIHGDESVLFIINRVLNQSEIVMIADTESLELFTKILFFSYIRMLYNHRNYHREELILVYKYMYELFSYILSYPQLLETFHELLQRGIPEILDVNHISTRGLLLNEIISYNSRPGVEFLLNNGADINKTDLNGISPIIMATIRDNLELFKLFSEKGASLYQEDGFGLNVIKRLNSKPNSKIARWMDGENI